MTPFPQAPLKFRTVGFPQYGFKQRRGLHRTRPSSPHGAEFDVPLAPCRATAIAPRWPRGMSGWSSPSRTRRCPRVLRSAWVLLSHGILATTTRSASLAVTSRLTDSGLCSRPCDHDTFPALDRRPFDWCHHPYAGADAGCIGPLPSPASIGLRPSQRGSAARCPTTCFTWAFSRRCSVRTRCGPSLRSPPRQVRPCELHTTARTFA